MRRLACLFAVLAAASLAYGQFDLPGGLDPLAGGQDSMAAEALSVRAVPSHTHARRGQQLHIAIDVTISPGWAWYSPDPGEYAQAGQIRLEDESLRAGPTLWPADQKYQTAGLDVVNHAYKKHAVVYVPVRIPGDAQTGSEVELTFHVEKQVCQAGRCVDLEGTNAVSASTKITIGDPVANAAWDDLDDGLAQAMTAEALRASRPGATQTNEIQFGQATVVGQDEQGGTLWYIFLALLAGLSFNIMPCVLPIVPMRIYSIVEMAQESRRRMVTLGLSFALGIVLFFAGIAMLNVGVTLARGQAYAWSEMWQYQSVRIGMALVLVALAASMFGLFTFQVPQKINQIEASGSLQKRGGHLSSLGMGFMMAILSTPCSGPVLASVMAWAQIQPLWLGTVVFLLLGAGMALPHAVLVAFPKLIAKLPKPGVWMEWFKQSMGFVLLLVVAWLLDTLSADGSPVPWVVAFAVVIAAGMWIWSNWVKYTDPLKRKIIFRSIAVLLVVGSGVWLLQPDHMKGVRQVAATKAPGTESSEDSNVSGHAQPLPSEPFKQVQAAWSGGRPVVVKFTAKWCLECKVVQKQIYDDATVQKRFQDSHALVLKADVTNKGSAGSDFMNKAFPGKAPPLTAVFVPGDTAPHLLTGVFSKDELFQFLPAQTAQAGQPN